MLTLKSLYQWSRPWLATALGLMVFFHLMRWVALFYYGPWESLLTEKKFELLKGFGVSLRFDGVSVCYGLIIPLLFYFFWLVLPGPRIRKGLIVAERSYFVFWTLLYVSITSGDLGYYSYFQDHINVLIFGFFEDDTWALIKTFQKNYPLPLIFLATFFIFVSLILISKRIFTENRFEIPQTRWNPKLWATSFLCLILLGVGARGSVGLFPLHEIDAAVSPEPFVNYLGYSGIHGLHRAIKVRSLNKSVWNANGKFYGYSNWQDAARDQWSLSPEQIPEDPIKLIQKVTPKNTWAEKTKPHVVMLLMESWGGYWLKFDSDEFNLTGSFREHMNQDFTFMNFLPSMTATIGSLTALMVNSPHRPEGNFLSESRYMQVPFRFSPARIYQQAGYKTRFVYGGGIGWRSVDRFAKIQGFDSIEGDFAIEKKLSKKLEKHDWGIYDGDVFEYVEQTLNEATSPEFVFVLTTSNHPPYQVPSDYKPLSLTPPAELRNQFTSDQTIVQARFTSYQYANQMLGDLMTRLKKSALGQKVVLGASGDHGFMLVNYGEGELLQKWQVPFYLYVPSQGAPTIKNKSEVIARFGSHMDIFPTLYNLSLSQTQHYSFGYDLLDNTVLHRAYHFSRLAMSKDGAVISDKNPKFFSWKPNDFTRLLPSEANPELEKLDRSYRSLMGFLDYFYEFELQHSHKQAVGNANKNGDDGYAHTGR